MNQNSSDVSLNYVAEAYVRLCLDIGQYDLDFVDAYYGPDSLRPSNPKSDTFPKRVFLARADSLMEQLGLIAKSEPGDTVQQRIKFLQAHLLASKQRVKIFSGEYDSFDRDTEQLFGVISPMYPESHFKELLNRLDTVLPGNGSIGERFQQLADRFTIPSEKLDTVFKAAIIECRQRTLRHFDLPEDERFDLEFVNNKPWSGYNWYKGNYRSLIQINTDVKIQIDRAIDVGSHESYPGHHVYNMLLEKNLYRGRGWVEVSVYPLFSPQSLIAEGSANYGIEMAFPGIEKNRFAKEVLLPLAGLDTSGIDTYFTALALRGELDFARNEVARGLVNGTMSEEEATRWLKDYVLMSTERANLAISFIKKYRSYVINYNYGQELVRNYMESSAGEEPSQADQWKLFERLLSEEVLASDLLLPNR